MWQTDWPQVPGYYWFYGWRVSPERGPRLGILQVLKVSNGFIYVLDGNSMFKAEGGRGQFLPMETPKLPELH